MFGSIRIRLLFSHLAVIILAMGLSGVLLISFLKNYFLQATEESLISQARITAQALIPGALLEGPDLEIQSPLSNAIQQQSSNLSLQAENVNIRNPESESESLDFASLKDASLQLGNQLETRIRIMDPQGYIWVDSANIDSGNTISEDALITEALAEGFASRNDDEVFELMLPAFVNDQVVGIIYLSQPLQDVIRVLRDVQYRFIFSTGVALIISGVVGLILSAAITRPIERLTLAANKVAKGDFDQQVYENSRDELGVLAGSFNEMTKRLDAARQMQVDFVANVSHELRTPLTSIKGMVETLRGGAVEKVEVRGRFLKTIEEQTDRLSRLVDDLLLLSQVDSEALNVQRELLDIGDFVEELVQRFSSLSSAKTLDLKADVAPQVKSIMADRDCVEQILYNLIDNAYKYAKPNTDVVVRVRQKNDQFVQIDVEDQGVGISPHDLPQIGERFYRADAARSRDQGGSGLGLAIVRALVDAHGGEMWINSTQGVGTVVSFTLPKD